MRKTSWVVYSSFLDGKLKCHRVPSAVSFNLIGTDNWGGWSLSWRLTNRLASFHLHQYDAGNMEPPM